VYEDEQVIAERLIIETIHSTLGKIRLPGSPLKFENSRDKHTAPPTLGEHSKSILAWLEQGDEDDL
jgi:formyl-CoA transferase